MSITILLGAEGCRATKNMPWIRAATDLEIIQFKIKLAHGSPPLKYRDLLRDHNGNHYWARTIDENLAPADIVTQAKTRVRIWKFRLESTPEPKLETWTHSICNACYGAQYPGRRPLRILEPEVEECCYCGERHQSGIYVRVAEDDLKCEGVKGIHWDPQN